MFYKWWQQQALECTGKSVSVVKIRTHSFAQNELKFRFEMVSANNHSTLVSLYILQF